MNPDNYEDEKEQEEASIEIPENPTLDDIARLSLEAYKEQMEDLMHVEPKNRNRHLEVAQQYLNQAKDAIYKRDSLDSKKQASSNNTSKENETEEETNEGEGKIPRRAVVKSIKEKKKDGTNNEAQ